MRKSKRKIAALLCAAITGVALLSFAGCSKAGSPYEVYGGYTKLGSNDVEEGGIGSFGYYYYSFGFLQDEYLLDEVEMTFYFAMNERAFSDLLDDYRFVQGYAYPILYSTYCYAYNTSGKAELENSTYSANRFLEHATLNKAANGVCLFNKIETDSIKKFSFETYRIETRRRKSKGFGSIEDNRQIGYAYSQQVKIPREMFEGENGDINFSVRGVLTSIEGPLGDKVEESLNPVSTLARIFYQVEGDRVRIATTNNFN